MTNNNKKRSLQDQSHDEPKKKFHHDKQQQESIVTNSSNILNTVSSNETSNRNNTPNPNEPTKNSKLLIVNYLNNEQTYDPMEIPQNFITINNGAPKIPVTPRVQDTPFSTSPFEINSISNSSHITNTPRTNTTSNSVGSKIAGDYQLIRKYNDLVRDYDSLKKNQSTNESKLISEISQLKRQVDQLQKLNTINSSSTNGSNSNSDINNENIYVGNSDLMKEIMFIKQLLCDYHGPVLDSVQKTTLQLNKFEEMMKSYFDYYKCFTESNFLAVDDRFHMITEKFRDTDKLLFDYFHGINKLNNIKAQQQTSSTSSLSSSSSDIKRPLSPNSKNIANGGINNGGNGGNGVLKINSYGNISPSTPTSAANTPRFNGSRPFPSYYSDMPNDYIQYYSGSVHNNGNTSPHYLSSSNLYNSPY